MRIAIVGQTLNTNFEDKISGGIQTVERLHTRVLVERGHDVHFIAPKDSEFGLGDMTTWEYWANSFEAEEGELGRPLEKAEKAKLSKAHAAFTLGLLTEEIQPDLIINHSFSSSHVRVMAEVSKQYPVACYVHNTPDTAMDIGVIAKVQHYKTLTENGGALVCVSRYQRDLWRSALKKRISSGSEHFSFLTPEDVDKIYAHFTYPVYVNTQALGTLPSEPGRFIVITRPDPIKNLHKLLELCESGVEPFPLDIFIAHPSDLESNEYFRDKIKGPLDSLRSKGWDIQLFHNAPRDDLLAKLSVARGCFIPCTVEAAPVVLLEAASYGVPSIVFGKERDGILTHASQDLLGDRCHLINVSGPAAIAGVALNKAVKSIEFPYKDRQILHDYTSKHHSFENRVADLEDLATMLMAQKQPTKPSLISYV